jgi:hypothetical protein
MEKIAYAFLLIALLYVISELFRTVAKFASVAF